MAIGDGTNDVFVTKNVDAGTVTGTVGIEALKEVSDTATSDDLPVITAKVAYRGCGTHENP